MVAATAAAGERLVVTVLRGAGLAAATGRTSAFGAATVVCGAGFMTGIGSVVVATTGSAPTGAMARRGHVKSSLRPAGGETASPFTSTRVTDFGADVSPVSRGPISSCAAVTDAVSGTTGPASGRAAGPLGLRGDGRRLRLARWQRHRLRARSQPRLISRSR